MCHLLITSIHQITRIRNFFQILFFLHAYFPKCCRKSDLFDKISQCLYASFSHLFIGTSISRNFPYIFRKPGKFLCACLTDMPIINRMQHSKSTSMTAVGISTDLMLHLMAFKITFFAELDDPVLRHGRQPHQITSCCIILRIYQCRTKTCYHAAHQSFRNII